MHPAQRQREEPHVTVVLRVDCSHAQGALGKGPPQLRLGANHRVGEEGSIVNWLSRHSSHLLQLQQLPARQEEF